MQSASQANWRQDIADVLQENQLGEGMFVGEQVYPVIPVAAQDGRFHKLAFTEVKTAAVDDKAGGASEANQVQHELTTDTYAAELYKLKEFVSERDMARFGDAFDAEVSAAELCRYYMRLNREKRIADVAFDTASTFASYTTAATTAWTTAASATPVDDVEAAKQALIDQVNGMVRGTARIIGVGNYAAKVALRATADIKDRWTQANGKSDMADLSDEQIASALGLDAVYFSRLAQGSSQIWDATKFGVYIVSDNPQLRSVPRVGNILLWRDSAPTDMAVKSWTTEDPEGTWVMVKTDCDEKLISARCGHILTGVTA